MFLTLSQLIKSHLFKSLCFQQPALCESLRIPAFSWQDSRTFPQPIKDGIIRLDCVEQICNQAKTLQLEL